MSKILKIITVALIGASASAVAMDEMKMGMKMDMKMMDTNGDGAISKDEFMRHHEMMYEKMKKNKSGTVDVKDMSMMMAPHDTNMMSKGKPKDSTKTMDGMSK